MPALKFSCKAGAAPFRCRADAKAAARAVKAGAWSLTTAIFRPENWSSTSAAAAAACASSRGTRRTTFHPPSSVYLGLVEAGLISRMPAFW